MADAQETNSAQADTEAAEAERTLLLDDMERLQDDGTLTEEDPAPDDDDPKDPEEDPKEDPEEDPDADDDDPDEKPDSDDDDPDEDPEEDPKDDAADDAADTVKAERLEAVRVAEQRAKASIAEERAKLDTERTTMAEQVAAVAEFDKLKRLAASDPVAVFRALVGDDLDLEHTSHQFFLEGKGKDDPKFKAKAQELARMRGNSTENAELRGRLDAMEKKYADDEASAVEEQRWDTYLDGAVTTLESLNGEAPLLKAWAKNAPKSVRAQMRAMTKGHFEETGEVPSPEQVIAALEKVRHTMLTEQGIDPKTVGEKTDKKTKTKQDAETKSKAKKKKTKKPTDDEPKELTRDEMIAAVEKFEAEADKD